MTAVETETTQWSLVILSSAILALITIEYSAIGMGEWPYMKILDPIADPQFFGFSTSAAKFAHAIFALIFSVWSYKIDSIKKPLVVGRAIAVVACILYLNIENFPANRRYVTMIVYILLGISHSSATILRAYVAKISTNEDRPKAYACLGLSLIFSIVAGPIVQLVASSVSYPGIEVLPMIRLHVYSVPIWCSFLLTLATIIVIAVGLKDEKMKVVDRENSCMSLVYLLKNLNNLKSSIKKARKADVEWNLAAICLICKIAASFSHAIMQTIMSMFFMIQYGWTGEETIRASSTILVIFGCVSCTVLLMYIFGNLCKYLPHRFAFLGCLVSSAMFFVITYPYPMTSQPIASFNETTQTGCSPAEYSWCTTSTVVQPIIFFVSAILLKSPCVPVMHTSLDTIYSKILQKVDQRIPQGFMIVIDDVIFMITPIFTTTMFVYYGIAPLWIANTVIFSLITIVWASSCSKMKKYE